jgi:GH15 family glucan-1,4-alpha-glucosidase
MAHALRNYALLADGLRGALIGPDGDLSWMCFPAWHDPAVFGNLIGGSGCFSVRPLGRCTWGGYYEPGSLIWRSRWITRDAVVECREALAMPGDRRRACVLRQIHCLEGAAVIRIVLEAGADYGRRRPGGWRRESGGYDLTDGELHWRVVGLRPARPDGAALSQEVRLASGESRDVIVQVSDRSDLVEAHPDADQLWDATEAAWHGVHSEIAVGEVGARDVRHALSVLHGMTAPGGGTVAAATTSLPERADEGRSYDYRYVWLRDLCYVGEAGAALDAPSVVEPPTGFVVARLLDEGDRMAPAYTIDGDPVPRQHHLGLPGYPGGGDLVGNHVRDQFQLDVFGEALLLLADADRLGVLGPDGWKAVIVAADAIAARRDEPDCGIWELEPQMWTHSRLVAAAGLRAVSRRRPADAAGWLALADDLVAHTSRSCVHPSGRWQRSPTDSRVDASLVGADVNGALGPDDPRALATYEAVRTELAEDGYVYRFAQDGRPLGRAEGAFLLCSFWMSLAAHRLGRREESARWFERGRAGCGPPGLLAEEFDVQQRQLRGNLPQAFVHALLVQAATVQCQEPPAADDRSGP